MYLDIRVLLPDSGQDPWQDIGGGNGTGADKDVAGDTVLERDNLFPGIVPELEDLFGVAKEDGALSG